MIADKEDVPRDRQRLRFEGMPLEDARDVGKLQHQEDATLLLLLEQKRSGVERGKQWPMGLGFHGPAKKACPAHGWPMGLDKPIAKCGNCERESFGSLIRRYRKVLALKRVTT
jgi:hypothetical protein